MTRKMMMIKKTLLMVLMVTFGTTVSWGQDYSGTYYIASGGRGENNNQNATNKYTYNPSTPSNNFYLCPTEGWCYYQDSDDFWPSNTADENKTMPFLTTYKCRSASYHDGDASDAVWIIKKAPNSDYYYIIQKSTGRYLVSNGQIRTTNNPDRIRVHLQPFSSEALAAAQGDKVLFEIVISSLSTSTSTYIEISPKGITDGTSTAHNDHDKHKWLTVNNGNYNYLIGRSGKTGGPTGYENTCGIVCLYSKGDNNAPFCLEDVIARPTISYDSNNKVVITAAQTGATIKYTLDGTTPSADHGTEYDTPLEPALGTTIKAVAIKDGEVSNTATFTYIKLADSYVIQSKDCEFYNLIPNLKIGEDEYPKNLTTLNVPCNTMVWDFENAADNDGQYYYIHNSQGGYMYYTATGNNKDVYFNANKDESDNGYKFSISAHASGGFNIIPKGQTLPINKSSITASGNTKLTAVKLAGTLADATSRWALITYSEETPRTSLPQWRGADPFTVSDDEQTYYYRIKSVSQSTKPLILDNDRSIKSETVPTSDYDSRKSVWVIKKVGTDTDGLLDYYTFQNAYTGEFLYLNKLEKEVKDDSGPGMLQMGQPTVDGANATWSHFVIVQTLNGYNIIPRVLVDNTKATGTDTTHEGFNCINRANGSIYTGTWYDNDGGSRWTFEQKTDVKCMNPTFAENTDENFTISCVTNAAVIHYTTNGEDPTASSSVYSASAPIESASEKICIKAIAIVGDGSDEYSKSEIVTLMNIPDITLKEGTDVVDDNTYIYDGTAKVPSVTVSIGNVVAPTDTYTTGYANNTDAGTETSIPTVTITDVDNDLWIINTAPRTFVINPRELTLTWTNTELEYTGTEQKPTLTVGNIVEGETLTTTVSILEDGGGINAGDYTAKATIEENSNYTLPTDVSSTTSYVIKPKSLGDGISPSSGISVTLNDGAEVTFTVMHGAVELTPGTDYIVSGPVTDGASQVWTITGQGNYTDEVKVMRVTLNFDNTGEDGAAEGTKVKVAPYVAPADMTIDGVEVYMVTHVNMTKHAVTIKKILTENADPTLRKNYALKDVPLLLLKNLAAAKTSASLTVTPINVAEGETADVSDNLLRITPAEGKTVTFGEVYMYYQGMFIMTTGGQMPGKTLYLERTPGSSVSSAPLYIVFDETTGIETVHDEGFMVNGQSDRWYTVDGRRLIGKPTKKGLYIKNGEKIIIK